MSGLRDYLAGNCDGPGGQSMPVPPEPKGPCRNGTGATVPVETRREMARLYQVELLPLSAIALRTHWSKTTIRNVLRTDGVPPRAPGWHDAYHTSQVLTRDKIDAAVELYGRGFSMDQVAGRLGLTYKAVSRRLNRAGVPTRSKSEGQRVARREAVSRGELTPFQRAALTELELAYPRPVSTLDICARLGVSEPNGLKVLYRLKRFGLVKAKRSNTGKGRPYYWSRTGLALRDVLDHMFEPPPGLKPADEYLNIAPFREWLEDQIAREERKAKFSAVATEDGSDGTGGIPTVGVIGQRMGIPERVLWRFRCEQKTIALSTADKLLQAYAGETTIYDLWPHLAEVDEEAAA